jgi:HPt (histidine-containing phosphotransfer) domain-containing protein
MTDAHFSALLPIYLDEAQERLGTLERAADELLVAPLNQQAWSTVKQIAHALAGNSAMMGFGAVARAARTIEERAIAVETAFDAARADALFVDRGFGALRCLIECVARRATPLGLS